MRLARALIDGTVFPAMLDGAGTLRDLSGVLGALEHQALTQHGLDHLRALAPASLPALPPDARLLPPVGGIGKIIGVGLNYRDHAAETGLALPSEPTLFLKATSALAPPVGPVMIPRDAHSLDWEVELGVVIGDGGAYIPEGEAMAHVAGYCLGIDFSERDFQFKRGGQGFKGKSADSFAPLGPYLVTQDDIPDPQALRLQLWVNGALRQDGSTADMIFPVSALVAYCSRFMSLQPGDVILTGTPVGVGMGATPPSYLRAGDEVKAAGDGLGEQHHAVVTFRG